MSCSIDGPEDWNKTMMNQLWGLYLKGVCVDLKLEAINGELLQIHSSVFNCCCNAEGSNHLKLPYPKDIVEKVVEFLYTGSINEAYDDDIEPMANLASSLKFNELKTALKPRLDSVKSKYSQEEMNLPNTYIPEPIVKPLTSTEVFLKYKNSHSDSHKMDFTKSTLTAKQAKRVAELYKKNPKLFAKPVKIKLSGDSNGVEKIINVSVKQSCVGGKMSLQIIQTPSSIKIKDTHKALRLQNMAFKSSECFIPPEGPWKCSLCSSVPHFNSYYECRQHLKNVHDKRFDSRICEYCGFKSYRRTILFHHAFMVHGIPPPKNCIFPKCDKCEYIAANSWDLQKHAKTHAVSKIESSSTFEGKTIVPESNAPPPPQNNVNANVLEPLHLLNLAVPISSFSGVSDSQTMYILTEDPTASQFAGPLFLASQVQGQEADVGKAPTSSGINNVVAYAPAATLGNELMPVYQ